MGTDNLSRRRVVQIIGTGGVAAGLAGCTGEEVYGEAQQIMMEKAAVIPLYYEEYVVGTYRDIQGVDLRPIPEMSRWPGLEHLK